MDGKKVLEVIGIYRSYFETNRIGLINYPRHLIVSLRKNILAHCHGMLDKMEEFVAEDRMGKAFRWLGFIQGCLWATGCYTLEELKNHNRPSKLEMNRDDEI
ncbi:MAG: hypothetical protein Q8R55_00710 [Candidatus Taylorbacteria bacterium]|nr:hypothetical protein [Candidatus Taylorbacteria bacterium]